MGRLGDQDKAKFFGMIAGGEVDKKAIEDLKKGVNNQQVQESFITPNLFENDKTFFVEHFFTKEILSEAIKNTNFVSAYNELLVEASGEQTGPAAPAQNRPLRKAMQYSNKLADEFAYNIANKLQELYGKNSNYGKDNRYIKNAIPKIMDGVNKRIDKQFKTNFGVSTLNTSSANPADAPQDNQQPSSEGSASASSDSTQTQGAADSAQGAADSTQSSEQPNKPGFIQRVLKFVSNPKVYITAGIAVAVVGFIAAVMGGAPVAAILGIYAKQMAMGSTAKMFTGAITRKIKGQKAFDVKSIATDAGKGALLGAFSAGLASIASTVGGMLMGTGSASPHPAQPGAPEVPQQSSASTPEVPAAAPIPSTPKFDSNEIFKIATQSDYTGAQIDKPRMGILNALINANAENNLNMSKNQIAKVFGDWSARADVGAGTTNPQAIINAINNVDNQKDLVNLMMNSAKK